MSKFLVDLSLDGYATAEEHNEACKRFIFEQLEMPGVSVRVEAEDCRGNKSFETLAKTGETK